MHRKQAKTLEERHYNRIRSREIKFYASWHTVTHSDVTWNPLHLPVPTPKRKQSQLHDGSLYLHLVAPKRKSIAPSSLPGSPTTYIHFSISWFYLSFLHYWSPNIAVVNLSMTPYGISNMSQGHGHAAIFRFLFWGGKNFCEPCRFYHLKNRFIHLSRQAKARKVKKMSGAVAGAGFFFGEGLD